MSNRIKAIIEPNPEPINPKSRAWKLALFNPDGSPYSPGAGGGGVALGPKGEFGDPTQEPCFVGWFHNVDDLMNLDTSNYKQGCWALSGANSPANPNDPFVSPPQLWVMDADGADGGGWEQAGTPPDAVNAMAKAMGPTAEFSLFFSGAVGYGMMRQIFVPDIYDVILQSMTASLGVPAPPGAPIGIEFAVGTIDGAGNFTARESHFTDGAVYIGSGQHILSQRKVDFPGTVVHQNDVIQVSTISTGGGDPAGAADLLVRIGYRRA